VAVDDEFWEILISRIEEGGIVPVVGPEVLIVPDADRQVPLYRLIAERLAAKFELKAQLREGAELNDAVCSYLDERPRALVEDLYPEVFLILKSLKPAPPASLQKLAGISGFNLFVTTTMDSLLVAALDRVRFPDQPRTLQIAYSPSQSGEAGDLPEGQTAVPVVFNLFGKATSVSNFAIHDEDYLEFVYRIETGQGAPARLLRELRTRDLLFIGCQFSDWLNRFVIRLASSARLRVSRERREYIASRESIQDGDLTRFLNRFSMPTRVLDVTGTEFIDELFSRWSERHPAGVAAPVSGETGVTSMLPAARGAIFISYAREDFAAANALRAAVAGMSGNDVCWFDKRSLKPGDRWEQEIRTSIERSVQMFLPVISRNTEQRDRGVVFEEWNLAIEAQKRQGFAKKRFIVPVVIDPDFDGELDHYQNIPDQFRAMNFGRAPQGAPDESLKSVLKEEIRRMRPRTP
jgi:hypothetical protein